MRNPPTKGAAGIPKINPATPKKIPSVSPSACSNSVSLSESTISLAKPSPPNIIGDAREPPMKTSGARAGLERLLNLVSASIALVKLLQCPFLLTARTRK